MKINVTVDLGDFFSEDNDMSFSDQVKQDISNRINRTVWESLNKEMVSAFENQVKRKIELDKDLKIIEKIDDLFTNQKLRKSPWSSNELVSLSEFIELELTKNFSISREFDQKVEKLVREKANELTKELKDRYDLLFASQIVSKLNQNGMLAEGVGKMLLGSSYPHNPNNVSTEIQRANALLMSKAPEMLEFITYVSNTIPKGSMLQEKAERLIKEATELKD